MDTPRDHGLMSRHQMAKHNGVHPIWFVISCVSLVAIIVLLAAIVVLLAYIKTGGLM